MTDPTRAATPRSEGFRMPAEWEPHERCWMQWPHRNPGVWVDLERTQAAYARTARAIRRFEPVTMIVSPEAATQVASTCGSDIELLEMELDDAWARDTAPSFVVRPDELAATVFDFNAWGAKYSNWSHDAEVGHRIAAHLGIRVFSAGVTFEGGALHVDGEGTILTSEQTILHPNRNRGLTRERAERILCESLGADKVIWLPGDPDDDETDGHVDFLACFVRPGVVLCQTGTKGDPERQRHLDANLEVLRRARDARGRPLEVLTLDENSDADSPHERFCRSYLNFYIANGGILLHSYGTASDEPAADVVRTAFPDHEVVTVDVNDIAVGGGGIHCITQQQPRVAG